MLNLEEFEVIKKEENEYYYKFTVVAKDRPYVCTQCLWDEVELDLDDIFIDENKGKKFIIHSSKEREITDIPIHGKPVKIILKHSRYKCPCCGKTFYQPFHCIERNDKVTLRLKHYIQQQSLRKPFLEVGYDCGLSHTSVRKYFKEQIEVLDKERNIKAPRVLGIDEAHLNKKMRGVFYCYGNFDILSKQKVLIFDKQLNFRQNITLSKGLRSIAGRTSNKLRMFPTASEYLLYYTKQDDSGLSYIDDNYVKPQNPFRLEIIRARTQVGLSTIDVAELGSFYGKVNHGGSVSNWEKGTNIPTKEQFEKLKTFLPIEREYCDLKNEYDLLREKYKDKRFTFNLPTGVTDVWEFTPDKVRYGHKTQKPQDITDRIIKASSNEGDLVYIPFAGSGSEIISCINNNRNYLATEINKKYIDEIIIPRIENNI